MIEAVVTGAGGFVGEAVVRELLKRGIRVLAVMRQKGNAPDGSSAIECDIAHYGDLPSMATGFHPEVFYHFAWNGTAGALRGDADVQLANVKGTCDAVNAAAAMGCRKFVFAASIMEYEIEAEVKAMRHPAESAIYSTGKLAADYMARIMAARHGLEYISGLISNIYGPGEKSPRLINSSIRKLMKGERLSLSPCRQMYDFIYIDDAARLFADIGDRGISGRTYYIGNRCPQPLKVFIEQLRDIVAPEAALGFGDIPFSGMGLSYHEFDTENAGRELGFEPAVSFAEGIRRTRNWIAMEDMET